MVDVPARDTAQGYRTIMDGWFQGTPGYAMEGDPFLERHAVAPDGGLTTTVCVRVRPVGQEGDFNMAVLEPEAAAVTPPGTAP